MCGIAGLINLNGERQPPLAVLQAMAKAIVHRGPDEEGFFTASGIGLVSRRLQIVGLHDGRQPISNENGDVIVVYNGEVFDYPELRQQLQGKGHRFTTHADTEVIPHLWEDHGEGMFDHLKGQFALALWDSRQRKLVLARDRFGICPLFWTRQRVDGDDWLMFASEIKALLATGWVDARPNPRGINHIFTFFALPGPVTCFAGVQALEHGHFLTVDVAERRSCHIRDRAYWQIDFPDRGHEFVGTKDGIVAEFESLMQHAVAKRLRADVPVVAYLSGGVDSSLVVAMAGRERGKPIPTFTIRITDPELDESNEATLVARHLGCNPTMVNCGREDVLENYPRLIRAAEAPVIDTACAALLLLAQEVHSQGFKVALTGEGADEWLAGYPWFRIHKLLGFLDVIPGLRLSQLSRRAFLRLTGSPRFPWAQVRRVHDCIGGPNAWLDVYGLMSLSKLRFYSREMHETLGDHVPYADLGIPLERLKRWHPLNRSLYFGARVMLPGLLLASKGDRVAMHSSVETRYPFLDEDVFGFLAKLHPSWKLRGLREKYALRILAERWLPPAIAWRRKAMFRAPFDSFQLDSTSPFIDQILSPESLRKTGYFDPESVAHWRQAFRSLRRGSAQRTSVEMGLVGVVATQMWHHAFIDSSLAEAPRLAISAMGAAPFR